jgi:hypothetical protein
MIQTILIILIFIAAVGYLVYMVRRHFSLKEGNCPKGCGCSSLDIEKIEKEFQKKNNSATQS